MYFTDLSMSFSTNGFCRLSLCKDEGEEGENREEEHHSEADLIHVAGLVSDLKTHKLTNKVENSSYSQISDVHNFTSVSFLIPVLCYAVTTNCATYSWPGCPAKTTAVLYDVS